MSDPVIRSSLQLLRARAADKKVDFWEVLELGLEFKDVLDAVAQVQPGTAVHPARIPAGPGFDYELVVTKHPRGVGVAGGTAAVVATPPPPAPAPAVDLEAQRVVEVNPIEVTVLEVWLELFIKGDRGLAHDVLANGLDPHHYWSFLPIDPAQIPPSQSVELTRRLEVLRQLIAQANRQLETGYKV